MFVRSTGRRDHRHSRAVLAALLAFLLTSTATAQVGPIDFKSREVKEGRNYTQRISALLAVGKSSGQSTFDFDFELPAGRGVTPSLALSYSSSGGASEVGAGWALTIPMIERSSQHGAPRYNDVVDVFRYREGHMAQDLVPTGELMGAGWVVYREQTERSYSLYLRRVSLIHSRGHIAEGGYCGQDGTETRRRAAEAPGVHG